MGLKIKHFKGGVLVDYPIARVCLVCRGLYGCYPAECVRLTCGDNKICSFCQVTPEIKLKNASHGICKKCKK